MYRFINGYICSVFCHQKIFCITFTIFLLKRDKDLSYSGDEPVRISGYFLTIFSNMLSFFIDSLLKIIVLYG